MLWPIIAFGSLSFWIILAVIAVVIMVLVENEQGTASFLALLTLILGITAFSNFNLFDYVNNHYESLLYYLGIYLVGGCVWPVVKWYFYALKKLDVYKERKADWMASQGIDGNVVPEDKKADFSRALKQYSKPPKVSENKGRILMWMSYWPLSLIYTVINDPFRRLFLMIYNRLGSLLQRISNSVFKSAGADFTN
jgi:hypothetical protein